MVPVTLSASASDLCDAAPSCRITTVSSTKPVDDLDRRNIGPDWEITDALTVNLRATRVGTGSGRVYTISVECADASNNRAMQSTTVTVPHDQGKKTGKK